jgi:hypothetical protein
MIIYSLRHGIQWEDKMLMMKSIKDLQANGLDIKHSAAAMFAEYE